MKDGEELNQRTFMHNPCMWKTLWGSFWGGKRVRLGGEKAGTTVTA